MKRPAVVLGRLLVDRAVGGAPREGCPVVVGQVFNLSKTTKQQRSQSVSRFASPVDVFQTMPFWTVIAVRYRVELEFLAGYLHIWFLRLFRFRVRVLLNWGKQFDAKLLAVLQVDDSAVC